MAPTISQDIIEFYIVSKIDETGEVNGRIKKCYAKGAFIYDVRCFFGILDLPTYLPSLYYISLLSKIRCSLTYLPTLKSDVINECSLRSHIFRQHAKKIDSNLNVKQ